MTTSNETKDKKPTCFVIMPISDMHGYEPGHFSRVYEHVLKPAILNAGYVPVRADDEVKTDYIVVGIIQRIVESEMVICDLSARNPNVMYELGVRHAFNKPVALVKDRCTDKVFDIQGLRYAEYDETLRIDSVQKDISKISSAITETGNAKDESMNSVVQLAGIKTAKVPEGQTVSADTQLVLSAIGTLDRRINSLGSDRRAMNFFEVDDDSVSFQDGTEARLSDRVYNAKHEDIGELIDIHPSDERIFVRGQSGKVTPFSATSVKSKGLSGIPF